MEISIKIIGGLDKYEEEYLVDPLGNSASSSTCVIQYPCNE